MHRLWSSAPPWVRVWLPGLLAAAVGAFGFLQILDEVLEQDAFVRLDEPLIQWLADHRTDGVTAIMTFITNLFGTTVLPLVVAVGCGVWGWRTRRWREPLLLIGAMGVASGLALLAKVAVGRARPAADVQAVPGLETSFSFPSGHTTGAATLVLVTGYLLWRRRRTRRLLAGWALASALIITTVGFTRMYLGYHFLTDVLAGAFVGLFTLGLVICADRWLDSRPTADKGHISDAK
ncbi:phosphatase PAP2 family protein [Demequina sp. B12]|uniref:phosphatase PAP2 family protein n=1 Tax=Demequina sp. B12 TaxID=2992757 RepID=UPI00237BFB71|nr:phosphatase PAP2 family protein [Demequina sp. B12]MDE0571858.1 phosphatase PAP2 family protein [Demequina sp. B12]